MRVAIDENDPGYTMYASQVSAIFLDAAPAADLMFTMADDEKREARVVLRDCKGKLVRDAEGDLFTALMTDVDVTIAMDEGLRKDIEFERAAQ